MRGFFLAATESCLAFGWYDAIIPVKGGVFYGHKGCHFQAAAKAQIIPGGAGGKNLRYPAGRFPVGDGGNGPQHADAEAAVRAV